MIFKSGIIRIADEIKIKKSVTVTGTGSVNSNVLQLFGSVKVLDQYAIITRVGTLTNMTDVYADLWDGTNSVPLTKSPGAILSGATVGSFFTKDKASSETYTVNISDECRMAEATNKNAIPFIVTQKNENDTYIRFNFTTTDNPIDFDIDIYFIYEKLDGGRLIFL